MTTSHLDRKICTVTGLDSRGLPYSVQVEASSLYEAAAAGLEQLHKNGCLITQVQVAVLAPVRHYKVHPRQLERWLRSYGPDDTVGLRALKGRIRDIIKQNPTK